MEGTYNVILTACPQEYLRAAIGALRLLRGDSLVDCIAALENPPKIILEAVSMERAQEAKGQLEAGVDSTNYGMPTKMPPEGETCCTVEIVPWKPQQRRPRRELRRHYPGMYDNLEELYKNLD